MNWPDAGKYHDAVQSPQRSFADVTLQAGSLLKNKQGLPIATSGQFAVVFQVVVGQRKYAVKCFIRKVVDQRWRYAEIDRHIAGRQLPILVEFQYLDQGIRVDGQWYPIVKMAWVPGESLSLYVEGHLHRPQDLRRLADEWRKTVASLRQNDIAHGDLQHGNIKVDRGQIKLIDYDGMYVPALRSNPPREFGARHYQHPQRAESDYGENIDNFSSLVIYLSLLALAAEPRLWTTYTMSENLILRDTDFKSPGRTPLWQQLMASPNPEVPRLATLLAGYCRGPVAAVPSLEAVVSSKLAIDAPGSTGTWYDPPASPSQDPPEVPWYDPQSGAFNSTLQPSAPTQSARPPKWYDEPGGSSGPTLQSAASQQKQNLQPVSQDVQTTQAMPAQGRGSSSGWGMGRMIALVLALLIALVLALLLILYL